ncbi:tRNA (adenosine(37)-N6)-threonylcarbamoyltransferase complex dimerization subunit type 1 TsaB [Buchnera aphidicola (Hormaphis cornu)]|nr:tRNA (adenosine(37)-N6)-threonylcarbamoyltransferase complex dimerization subunit type 1 TsaB [Buchnera aphidicola (Hormaphis cornu)]
MSKKILALDTSGENCSVALLKDNYIDHMYKKCNHDHGENILPMIKNILWKNSITINELNAIAFSQGPGKFTGLRISSGIAQGLSLVYNTPLIGISTLSILAEKSWEKEKITHVITLLHAQTNKIYWAQYIRNHENIWSLKKLELMFGINNINYKLSKLEGTWLIIGNKYLLKKIIINANYKLYLKFFYIKYFNAKDIIPIALFTLKSKHILSLNQAIPYYLE